MKFEWDEDKNSINKEKHKISFETAAHVFDDPDYIEMFDFEHSIDEDRYCNREGWGCAVCGIYGKKRSD